MKYCFGPLSTNIIDVIIKFANLNDHIIGLIPSRRQVDYNSGYVGFNTLNFSQYVKERSNNIILIRDHGGPLQGDSEDSGIKSLIEDSKTFDIIHIDPFKKFNNMDKSAVCTHKLMTMILEYNPNQKFEIGTEEAIRKYSHNDLFLFIDKLYSFLDKIEYVVIQTGCKICGFNNYDNFNLKNANSMMAVAKYFNLKTKEHNGDFLEKNSIKKRFNIGLDSINIAPQLGILETETILLNASKSIKQEIINCCVKSNKWKKWLSNDYSEIDKTLYSGHYLFNDVVFQKLKYTINDIDEKIQNILYKFITELYI